MKAIRVLTKFPVILTKDKQFLEQLKHPAKEGSIFILPDDAVLVLPKVEDPVDKTPAVDQLGPPQDRY